MKAINLLIRQDAFLLQCNVNERSMSHKLAEYLQKEFRKWHVDCEYNRDHDLTKKLVVPNGTTRIDDTEAKTVFPDIIVHHRNENSNLLVIEVKKTSNPDNGNFDRRKLEEFIKPPFNYQYGLFLRLNVGVSDMADYELDWFPKDPLQS
ncbi:hypothetical protein PJI16_11900 [Nitrospira sp. MA-1]|nr:hypothetical protein [Nitrospira sp. MA-1]